MLTHAGQAEPHHKAVTVHGYLSDGLAPLMLQPCHGNRWAEQRDALVQVDFGKAILKSWRHS